MQCEEFDDGLIDQIIYRGEGNSSIVVALKNKSKVIRLLKKDGKLMRSRQDHHSTQHPLRSIKFIHLIMKPLTAPFLSETTELAHLKSRFIDMLSKRVEAERPSHRLDKTLRLDDQYALFMDDLCALPIKLTRHLGFDDLIGPTLSIEIKPKQGFLPHISRSAMKSSVNDSLYPLIDGNCLYGLTQHLKLARGRITETSNYCPINLYSGCPIKMRSALEALLKQPQNNFRIFKDLMLVFGETSDQKLSHILDDFFHQDIRPNVENNEIRLSDLLIQCLLYEPKNIRSSCDDLCTGYIDNENLLSSDNRHNSCLQHPLPTKCRRCDIHANMVPVANGHKLPQSCVLASVLRAQRLDSIGVFEARHMLDWLLEEARTTRSGLDILEELSKPQIPPNFGSPVQLPSESRHDYYFRKVWEFLVSLTAKDCSIIITLRRIAQSRLDADMRKRSEIKDHLLRETGTDYYYLFNVGIADFDQKMPFKIMRLCDNLYQIANLINTNDRIPKEGNLVVKSLNEECGNHRWTRID